MSDARMDNYSYKDAIINSIKASRLNNKRPDAASITEYICKSFATNADEDYIITLIESLIDDNILENRPSAKGNSYFIIESSTMESVEDPCNR